MENKKTIKNAIVEGNERQILGLLSSGLDPNNEGGWMLRLAARYGNIYIVKLLIQFGANINLVGEAGSSVLQLAVYSEKHWEGDEWCFLLRLCNPMQLADGAAVAIIFKNMSAFKKIIETGRCNILIPTSLTGKTIQQLAIGYKLHSVLNFNSSTQIPSPNNITPVSSPRTSEVQSTMGSSSRLTPHTAHSHGTRDLSPSVARFFQQSSNQVTLTPNSRSSASSTITSPIGHWQNFRVN